VRYHLFWLIAMLVGASANCNASDSIYLTATNRIDYELGTSYTFIGPYFTDGNTELFVQIAKPDTSTSSKGSSSPNQSSSGGAANSASINFIQWYPDKKELRYAVSCDVSSLVEPNADIAVSKVKLLEDGKPGVKPIDPFNPFNGTKKVLRTDKKNNMYVKYEPPRDKEVPTYGGGGTIDNVLCASEKSSFTVSFGLNTIPKSRAYLYVSKNAFFADTINYSIDSNGMLSNLDTSSTQQITSILTELAQTAGALLREFDEKQPPPRKQCFSAIASLLKDGPYNNILPILQLRDGRTWIIDLTDGSTFTSAVKDRPSVSLIFSLERSSSSEPTGLYKPPRPPKELRRAVNAGTVAQSYKGLVAFFPEPARATLACKIKSQIEYGDKGDKGDKVVFLSAPSVVYLYTKKQIIDPQRDFLTNPQDTFTFNGSFITGHKYTSQSSAKTVVDTVTAPIRALFPSVSIQQQVQVQSGGGKPAQTTTSTQTTISPSKSQ
jgi:hypothetical protein